VDGNGMGNTGSVRGGREERYSFMGSITRCRSGVRCWTSVITTIAVLVFLLFFGIVVVGLVSVSGTIFVLISYLVLSFIPPIVYIVMGWL